MASVSMSKWAEGRKIQCKGKEPGIRVGAKEDILGDGVTCTQS
jgi:hypothetical protein